MMNNDKGVKCVDCGNYANDTGLCSVKNWNMREIEDSDITPCTDYIPKDQSERTFVGHLDGELEIRTFDTGATRDTTQGKLDYVKALSPIVLRRYVQYLDKHRLQPDGSYRDFDNWKQGMPQETYHSSNGRHFFDTWLLTEGYAAFDNHGPVELEDVLCAQLFNIQGRLHEILKAKIEEDQDYDAAIDHHTGRDQPIEGGY